MAGTRDRAKEDRVQPLLPPHWPSSIGETSYCASPVERLVQFRCGKLYHRSSSCYRSGSSDPETNRVRNVHYCQIDIRHFAAIGSCASGSWPHAKGSDFPGSRISPCTASHWINCKFRSAQFCLGITGFAEASARSFSHRQSAGFGASRRSDRGAGTA
jgi:hypothetical protein